MYDYNSPYAAVEDTLAVIRMSVDESIVDEYPFLLEVQAWAAFVEGRGMEEYLDRYFKQLPKIILQNPASAHTSILLRCIDHRSAITDVAKKLGKLPLKYFAQAKTPSITQNMPFLHRSSKDFSEFAVNTEEKLRLLRRTIGVLIGGEYEVLEDLLRAGVAYERGSLNEAHGFAASANTKLKDGFAPETKFCFYMILAAVLDAQDFRGETLKILDAAKEMIEQNKAYYLNANFHAFSCRLELANGDIEAARDWLKHHAESPYNALTFYKLYQHFNTARAYIVTGDYATAIIFLKKLELLCEQYRRPLDIIEINILLAVAYWKKARGAQNKAFEPLEKAVALAGEYGFTQVFANEGAELSNMLHKLQKRAVQKNYSGGISAVQVKTLYIAALAKAKRSPGLTGGRKPENLKFTERQKTVMRRLCEGFTQKQIAEAMGLKASAVKSHLKLIYKKLDASNAVEAMLKIKELDVL